MKNWVRFSLGEKGSGGLMLSPKEPSLTTIFGGREGGREGGRGGGGGQFFPGGGLGDNFLPLQIFFNTKNIVKKF